MSSSAASSAAAIPGPKLCFNASCKELRPEGAPRRKGWRLRSGDVADLCDRCSSLYEQGSFCDTFHADADGWRKCELCGKRVHCGCIVSATSFTLLDAGGIQCLPCAQKQFVAVPNQMWSSSSLLFPIQSERLKELPGKSWNQITSTNPVPGQWRPGHGGWSAAVAAQSELQQRLSYEFGPPSSIEKLFSSNRLVHSEKKKVDDLSERSISNSVNRTTIDRFVNGSSALKSPGYHAFHRDEGGTDGSQNSPHLVGDHEAIPTRKLTIQGSRLSSSTGIKLEAVPSPCSNISTGPALLKDETATAVIGIAAPFSSAEGNDPNRLSINPMHRQAAANSFGKQLCRSTTNLLESTMESQNLVRNGRPRMEGRGRSQLLPRYWPRITDQELQQISGDSNSVITPLFEKMLSASDAGRIGRLVLPKKCAEAYFPAISQPEGLPLKVQDATGKEWVFQFRFWPNNNSRMYVLEGVTPCIQSMQLQAGDTVTFSRIDPEGKLVMGFRKATNTQAEQVGNGFSPTSEVTSRSSKQNDVPSLPLRPLKGNSEPISLGNSTDQVTWSKIDKEEFIQKEGNTAKPTIISNKRKSSILGSKSKRLRIETEDSIELKLTWEEAQELLRPPPNHVPSIVVIDGHEIEEFEEAPVLGKPTIFSANESGGKDQWAQCEDCLKWRKLPIDALLPPKWTCSDNSWDLERSSCSAAQEITEQLAEMLPFNSVGHRKNKIKVESNIIEGSDGLDTLANLAILGEGDSLNSSQPTTKHPRHRPGCTCIVCIQPPSGKGPKHKQSCTCNVCLTVKRRFRTLMLRKEKRQSEKEAETARKKQQQQQTHSPEAESPEESSSKPLASKTSSSQSKKQSSLTDSVVEEDSDKKKEILLSIKTEIDLNIQPEREEEPSPVADAGHAMILLQSATS